MAQPILQLTESLNWDLVFRESFQATQIPGTSLYIPIPPKTKIVDSNILLLGINSPLNAKSSWWLGGWLSVNLFVSPSSTSEFASLIEVARFKIRRDRLTLIHFPRYEPMSYSVRIEIPRWFSTALVKLWKYSGPQSDSTEELLESIQADVAALAN